MAIYHHLNPVESVSAQWGKKWAVKTTLCPLDRLVEDGEHRKVSEQWGHCQYVLLYSTPACVFILTEMISWSGGCPVNDCMHK